jgi:hypothetical protein
MNEKNLTFLPTQGRTDIDFWCLHALIPRNSSTMEALKASPRASSPIFVARLFARVSERTLLWPVNSQESIDQAATRLRHAQDLVVPKDDDAPQSKSPCWAAGGRG